MSELQDLVELPTDEDVVEALRHFGERVRRAYGSRLQGLYLFGSRARGDHKPESDADVAIILEDGDWRFWDEKMRLIDLAFDYRIDNGVYIQSWPFAASHWEDPVSATQPRLIASAKRDATEIGAPS